MAFIHVDAFKKEGALIGALGEGNAYLVWALGLYLDHPDLNLLASESLTDQGNDKKIDFIRLDAEQRRIVVAQGYYSTKKTTDSAPANKASDLNTACAWIFNGDADQTPDKLKDIITDCRKAIEAGEIDQVTLLYVHNLPESVNVAKELVTVAANVQALVKDKGIVVDQKELGIAEIERLYATQESSIEVRDEISIPGNFELTEKGPKWEAGIVSVPGEWLRDLYQKYSEKLFSANYRGFLGISKRKKINSAIQTTAELESDNFWVYNNGITVLTLKIGKGKGGVILNGISIINGAQTTGSIGSVDKKFDLKNVRVLCRVIQCADEDTIGKIVRYNNTQNVITTWDQYSNSPEQLRIQKEFADIEYDYSLKRGFSYGAGAIIGIELVPPALIAFQGDYRSANIGKNYIFETRSLYKKAFEDKKARHILFVYTLSKAVDYRRLELKEKTALIELDEKQLRLLRNLRFKGFLIAVIAASLEVVLGKKINKDEIAFSPAAVKANDFNSLIAIWLPIVSLSIAYLANSITDDVSEFLSQDDALEKAVKLVTSLIYTSLMTAPNPAFKTFEEAVSVNG